MNTVTAAKGPSIWITAYTGNSGLTHYSYCLSRALGKIGVDVTLVTNRNYELDFLPTTFPVEKIFRPSRYFPVDIIRFWRRFRQRRPDIVHYQSFLKFPALELLLLELQKRSGAGLICTAHDWLPHHRRFYHQALFGRYYRSFDRVIVHSAAGKRFLVDELGVKAERLVEIPHGNYGFLSTDGSLTREAARQRLGLEPERPWFLFFGRIDPHKGLDLALRALAELKPREAEPPPAGIKAHDVEQLPAGIQARDEEPPPAGLIIAGNPEAESLDKYTRLIAELGIGNRVKLFPGHIPVEEIQIYFQAADAVVLPYRESSTSGIAHVAMGFGKPVVATAVGGLVDVIEDGVNGLLVPPGDMLALASALELVASDPVIRNRLGQGWSSSRERYSWASIAAETLKVYEMVDK